MAKTITSTWQEALKLASDCKVVGAPRLRSPGHLLIQLQDPAGQRWILSVQDKTQPALNGSAIVLVPAFQIDGYAPDENDKLWGPEPEGG